MKQFYTSNGIPVLVSDEDFAEVGNLTWRCNMHTGYIQRTYTKKSHVYSETLHQRLMGFPPGLYIDHIDGDKTNNQRSNLRTCTPQQSKGNIRKYKGTSKYKGVSWSKKAEKWLAHIQFSGKGYHLGQFDDGTEAAKAYDEKAKHFFGEFAWLNFKG